MVWLTVATLAVTSARAQHYVSNETFGKNRIQYRQFTWQIIRTTNFEIYYYQDGSQIANLTAQYAESEFDRITELLGYTPYNRIKIFLFNSPAERAQSNIGINTVGGFDSRETDLARSRIEIAFSGDQISFRRQLIRDVSMLFVYDMLYGGSLKDALQSSLLLSLPDWFMPGMAAYIADGYSVELDDYMRDISLRKSIKKPSSLTGLEAERVGQSIWNYIVLRYGKDNISNILNLTRIIRNEQSSIQSTLGVPYNRFLREWREYYTKMNGSFAETASATANDYQINLPMGSELGALRLSKDNSMIAYSLFDDGKFEVNVVRTANHKKYTLLQGGYRLDGQATRMHAPTLTFQPDNRLVVVFEENGKIYLHIYSNLDRKPKLFSQQEVKGLTQVVGIDAADGSGSVIMSAERKGQNDLFLYSIGRGTFQQLTNDLYDDLNPRFVGKDTRQIVFASNRLLDTLGTDKGSYRTVKDQFSLFRYEGTARLASLTRLTDSLAQASQPIAADDRLTYGLSTLLGIRNLYRTNADGRDWRTVTALPGSIGLYDLNPGNGGFVYSSWQNGRSVIGFRAQLRLSPITPPQLTQRAALRKPVRPAADAVTDTTKRVATAPVAIAALSKMALDSGEVDTDNYQFDPAVVRTIEVRPRRASAGGVNVTANQPQPRNRRRESVTIRGPFPYKGLITSSDAPLGLRFDPIRGFGFTESLTLTDLLENHVLRGGFYLNPTELKNSDLFLEYHNLEHRIDYSARIDRQSWFVNNQNDITQKNRYTKVAVSASYPFSVTSRFTVSPSYTLTRMLDLNYLGVPDLVSDYAGLRGEFVYDNTHANGMNMLEGTRLKVRFDAYGGIRSSKESFTRFTVDLRRYQKLHRDLVLALRVSYGQSGGPSPKKSTLGGAENWAFFQKDGVITNPLVIPAANESQPSPDYRDRFFLDVVTNLRGFGLGKLTGTSHLLFNAELRLPVAKYLSRGTIGSNFLRNLQLVAFTDIGSAWSGGAGPFSRSNSLNTDIYNKPLFDANKSPFYAVVSNFKNPFLIGYGAGLRTVLLGYYVKLDYAWGIENKVVTKPIAYLTLGYDF